MSKATEAAKEEIMQIAYLKKPKIPFWTNKPKSGKRTINNKRSF